MKNIAILFGLVLGEAVAHGDQHHHDDHRRLDVDSPFTIAGVKFANQQEFFDRGARCGTKMPSDAAQAAIEKALSSQSSALRKAFTPVKISVYTHVIISSTGEGKPTQKQLDDQFTYMNEAFDGTGFSFYPANFSCVVNDDYYDQGAFSSGLTNMKATLHTGGPADLNWYFTKMNDGTLGYATFPWEYTSSPGEDGVVILTDSLPGGSATNYNLGGTAPHETGHWLGLYHVFSDFDGTCLNDNDSVRDTPVQRNPTRGCPIIKDSCRWRLGFDSIHNYMDYSYDECYSEFTLGQIDRMQSMWTMYRAADYVDPGNPPAAAPLSCP